MYNATVLKVDTLNDYALVEFDNGERLLVSSREGLKAGDSVTVERWHTKVTIVD